MGKYIYSLKKRGINVIRYKQLITQKIMDKTMNNTIGSIKDVLYSEDYRKVNYLVVKNTNLFRNKIIIDYSSLSFLKNNIIIYNESKDIFDIKLDKFTENIQEGSKLLNKEIKNEQDECIGFIKDVVIDRESGKVDGFIITEGIFEDLLKGRNYIPLLDTISIDEQYVYIPSNIFI